MDGDAHIALLHHPPCSGGTIISRALAAMRSVVLISEVHPDMGMGRRGLPLKQAERAYGLVTSEDIHACFVEQIGLIHRRAQERSLRLVLRDHYAADFLAPEYTRLTSRDVLRKSFSLRRAFTVRHPVDVWLGLKANNWFGSTLEDYLERTLVAARHAAEAGFERYEDFVSAPNDVLKRLCERLDAPFDHAWRDRLDCAQHLTGDSGRKSAEIEPRPRRDISDAEMERFTRSPVYRRVLDTLGYPE